MTNDDYDNGSVTSADPPGSVCKWGEGIVNEDDDDDEDVSSDDEDDEDDIAKDIARDVNFFADAGVDNDDDVYHKKPRVMDENGMSWDVDETSKAKKIISGVGLLVGFILFFTTIDDNKAINQTLGVAVWMATLWLTELIPSHITAFLPIFMFPLFGILTAAKAAEQYFNDLNWLFISGFMISLSLERWNLHRRFALKILTFCGNKPMLLLFGIMTATFCLSMFISNTATALMMVTNGVSICKSLEEHSPLEFRDENKRFGIAVMLGIAYASNVGGMSSLIGTGPNLAFAQQLSIIFPDVPEFTFADWLFFGLPIGLLIHVITWGYLCFMYLRDFQGTDHIDPQMFVDQYAAMGPWSREQITVAVLFVSLAIGWVFRADLDFSAVVIPGWYNLFPAPDTISDTTIGIVIGFLLMIIPARASMLPAHSLTAYRRKKDGTPVTAMTTLLDWNTASKMPYDILFLLGGGFCLARAFQDGGLSKFLGDKMAAMDVSIGALVFILTFFIIWLTEITSNTSTANIMIPISAALAIGREASPFTFMIPATMACSCAFFLPIATPPNMVVYATGLLPLRDMNKAGVFLNFVCLFIIVGAVYSIIPAVLGVRPDEFPTWAANNANTMASAGK
jgi:solute carrier family 13 (sodium-dependent dicarboxylate transporter), member 2/3/5